MSTQSLPTRLHTRLGRLTFALLIGVVLALSNLLPSVAFARAHGQAAPLSADPTYVRDKAGASVVRLEVTSTNGDNATNPQRSIVTCTGLGVLVTTTLGSSGVSWVLTDANLFDPNSSTCALPNTTTEDIQILASTAYTQADPSHLLANPSLSSLGDTVSCSVAAGTLPGTSQFSCNDGKNSQVQENFIAVPNQFVLFSFQTPTQQPSLLPSRDSTSRPMAMSLTRAGHSYPSVRVPNSPVSTNPLQEYLVPTVSPSTPPVSNGIEPGTPLVDATGNLAGVSLRGGQMLNLSSINAALKSLPLPFSFAFASTPAAGSLTDLWDRGMDAYNQGTQQSCQTALRNFQQIGRLNANFKAATFFANRAQTCAQQPPQTKQQQQHDQSTSVSLPLLIGLIAGLVTLLLLLILATLHVGRVRRRRRELARFAVEQAEAQRQAEVQHQAELARRRTEVPCPNCHQPVHLSDTMCRNCRYPLSPSASGLSVRLAGSGPLAATMPIATAPLDAPMPPSAPSVSDLPTVQFPPNFGMNGEQHDAEITVKGNRSHQPEEIVYGLQAMHGRNLNMMVGTRTNPGLRRKQKPNEDNRFAAQGTRTQSSQPQQFGLFVVADGMGGHADGQVASRQAIQTVIDYMLPRISSTTPMNDEAFQQLLSDGVQNANLAVHNRNLETHVDMGTTMTAALVVGTTAYIANVGDSRTYVYRQEQGLRKVTMDHSVVASLVEAGIIQPDDIYTHPKRHQIYRSLGEKPVIEVDTFKEEMQPGDRLLLCSDGLWDMVRDPDIQHIVSKPGGDLDRLSQDLIDAALKGGGEDNVTVIVVQFAELTTPADLSGLQVLAIPDAVNVPGMPAS